MPRRLAPRNTAAQEFHPPQRQPRASADPAPLCLKGSRMERSGPLFDRWAAEGRAFGLLARRNESRDPCTALLPRSRTEFPA
eukprot:8308867-Pyramimonas_sp.AAC.1